MFYHLQNLFWGVLSGGFWLGGFLSKAGRRGVYSGGFCPGGCPDTDFDLFLFSRFRKYFDDFSPCSYIITCDLPITHCVM